MIHIGQDLKFLIEKKGLNKKELASLLDITEPSFYRILQKDHISTKLLVKFCNLLTVHPGVFFNHYEGNGRETLWYDINVNENDPIYELIFDEQRTKLNDIRSVSRVSESLLEEEENLTEELKTCQAENTKLHERIDYLNGQIDLLKDHVNSLKQVSGIK